MKAKHPTTVTISVVLLALFSLLSVVSPLIPAFTDGVPPLVVYSGVALGALSLVAAAGLWALKRWSVWLTIIVSLVNILSAVPGLLFAPTPRLFVTAIVGIVSYALFIVLVVLPTSRQAFVQVRIGKA